MLLLVLRVLLQSTADGATSASAAQSTLAQVNSNCANTNAIISCNTTAAASTAQSAIDTMETQVVLSSAGMDLRNDSNVNGQDVVQFGTTTKFFDGVDDKDGNMKLRLNTDGVHRFR